MLRRLLDTVSQYAWLIGGMALLLAVYLLPPDTSLSEVRRQGLLSACLPVTRPPLVTADEAEPGLEVELLQMIAEEIGVRFRPVTVPAMGEDFDLSLWRISRAQCSVVGGGTLDTAATRAFLDVTPPFGETGWVVLSRAAGALQSGATVAVLANVPGADRLGLSRFLRGQGVTPQLVRSPDDLATAIADGSADAGIADALYAHALAREAGLVMTDLPPPLGHDALVFGLWKGDLTLKRAIVAALARIRDDGRLNDLTVKYLD
ncbi:MULTISPECIES: transporter substrate-binding domain-containing protein [unclassified Devosia]|uniref:amino acid ABC transporter substrate-binding protein n=1 Tax=unclassified Devosia TaxID=196773 RepID=UPI00155359E6|nr:MULTISPECIES: transporter substrate-binding domain-containing protein [unclassified Devosia]